MARELEQQKRTQDLRFSRRYQLPSGALVSYALQDPQGLRESKYEGDAALVDLSIGGCKLRSDANLACSIYYNLILHSPGYPRPITIDRATIRWVENQMFGVRFTHINMQDVEHLHSFLLQLHLGGQIRQG